MRRAIGVLDVTGPRTSDRRTRGASDPNIRDASTRERIRALLIKVSRGWELARRRSTSWRLLGLLLLSLLLLLLQLLLLLLLLLLLVLVLLLLLLLLHLLLSCQQLLLHCQLLLLVRLDELLLTLHELIHLLPQLLVLSPDIQQCLLLRCKGLSGSRICRQPTGSPRVPVVRLRSCLWRWHRRLWLLLTLMLGCWWRWLWILLLALSLTLLSLFLETGTMSTLGDISEPVARLVTSEDRPIRAQPANASAVVTSEISARPTKPDAMVTPTPLLRTLPAEHELIVLLSHISPVA